MRALRRSGEQQPGETDRVDDVVRTRLPREQFIVLSPDDDADRYLRRKMPDGQDDQDRRVVASRRYQHRAGLGDPHIEQGFVARCIAFQHVAAHRFGGIDALARRIDDDNASGIGAARDQFVNRLAAADAEAQNDDVIGEFCLDDASIRRERSDTGAISPNPVVVTEIIVK